VAENAGFWPSERGWRDGENEKGGQDTEDSLGE
jgi:hypothetical protein